MGCQSKPDRLITMPQLTHLTVRGFKSIRALEEFELGPLNVLIGPNGAGKSNFIDLFRMLISMIEKQFRVFVAQGNRPDTILFGGMKTTKQIEAQFIFGKNVYRFVLAPDGERLIFREEETGVVDDKGITTYTLGSGHDESRLHEITVQEADSCAVYIREAIANWRAYHFHDTSMTSGMRNAREVRDNLELHSDASNLASFLRHLNEKYPDHHKQIVDVVQHAAPFLEDFTYRANAAGRVEFEWFHEGGSKVTFGPRRFSDGTLRFICLATLLLQPDRYAPRLMLIDEPELGLHPRMIVLLAEMLKSASEARQIIISTQSADLVNEMVPEDIVVVNRKDGESTFERLDLERLQVWLEDDYALGDLWKMNTFGGCLSR